MSRKTKKPRIELKTAPPEDIVYEIFLRLPVRSLARFKCVCKQWKSLISDSRLIKIRMKQNHEPNSTLFLFCGKVRGGMISPHHNGDTHASSIHRFRPQHVPQELAGYSIRNMAVGTCHGLICFSSKYGTRTALVWNPITNQLREFDFPYRSKYVFSFFGFGFDTINEDFKVVKINMGAYNRNLLIEIFELRNTEIREVRLQVPFFLSNVTPVTVNGSSHWIAFHRENRVLQIVRFDMDHDKFVEIPFSTDMPNIKIHLHGIRRRDFNEFETGLTPEGLAVSDRLVNNDKDFRLGVLKGSLCLFISDLLKMEAWLMNCKNRDDSDVEWTRLFDISLSHGTEEVAIGFTANDEVVIHNVFSNFAYDHWREMYLPIELDCKHQRAMYQAVAYVESFVNAWPR